DRPRRRRPAGKIPVPRSRRRMGGEQGRSPRARHLRHAHLCAGRRDLLGPGPPRFPRPGARGQNRREMTAALAELEAQVAGDLAYVDYPRRAGVAARHRPVGLPVRDVVIAGAGINGLAAAFGLLRERITNITVLDRAAPGLEGPWLTFARMRGLRTDRNLVGPDLGLPSLSFPYWYRATKGAHAWDRLDKA